MRKAAFALALLAVAPGTTTAQDVLQPADFKLTGWRDVHVIGDDTTYMRALTHRYVDGELRFLSLTHRGELIEFRAVVGHGETIEAGAVTGRWSVPGTSDHAGIWFEQAKSRLWITSSQDYTTETRPAHITTMTLNADGSVADVHTVYLSNVNEKRMYGGCQPSPVPAHEYVCGWGGYASLMAQGGGASMGPTMFGIKDPATYADGATIPSTRILDMPMDQRGVRRTLPLNYFDGGDPRQNPPTRPTDPPRRSAGWLSPARDGLGWMVWGDSYYNNAVYIDTGAKRGFVLVAALCGVPGQQQTTVGDQTVPGAGACWYQSSTLEFDGRTAELHIFDVSKLGSGQRLRPDSMTELILPRGAPQPTQSWAGNVPQVNISGVTYDSVTKTLYMVGYPLGGKPGEPWTTGRLYSFSVDRP